MTGQRQTGQEKCPWQILAQAAENEYHTVFSINKQIKYHTVIRCQQENLIYDTYKFLI